MMNNKKRERDLSSNTVGFDEVGHRVISNAITCDACHVALIRPFVLSFQALNNKYCREPLHILYY